MFSEPAIGKMFFGRTEVLDLLAKRVSALKDGYRQNVAFTGQSLSGKTSILHHFLYTIKEDAYLAVYVEIIKEPFKTFVNRFIATLLYNALAKLSLSPVPELSDLLDKSQKNLPKTSAAIKVIYASIENGDLDEAYARLLGLTSVIKDELKMPCIVILDEFDNLEHLGIKNPFLNFGKVIMVQKDTMYIVTSSRNQAIKKILSEKLSLLFGNFEIVKISGFDPSTSAAFIESRLNGCEIDPAAKRFLTSFCEGNPFYLRYLIAAARESATAHQRTCIETEVVVEAILDQVYDSNGTIHQYLLNFILELLDTKTRSAHVAALTAIANGRNKLQTISKALRTKPAEASKILIRLADLGFISKNGVFFKIDDPVLEFWLRYVYQKKMQVLVDDIFKRKSIYREEAFNYVSDCIRCQSESIVAKLADLFGAFSNELVPFNARGIKLPHFTRIEIKTSLGPRPVIAASLRGNYWLAACYESEITENDVIEYIKIAKASGVKITNRIMVSIRGIDENAKLLAKELRISIWDIAVVNSLFGLYGKNRFAI